MRIAIFSDNFYPELSGIADSILALAKQLAADGHKIVFYVPSYSAKNYKITNRPLGELELGENIQVKRLTAFSFPTANGQGRAVIPSPFITHAVRKFKPDVIHSQLFFGVGIDGLIAARKLKIPLIGTNHTAISEFAKYSPIKAKWFQRFSLKYAVWYYNQCDFVTAPSQSVFTEMKQDGFNKPHQVISNPIDLETFKPTDLAGKEELKKKFKLTPHTLFYAGRIAPEKNIDVIIRAMPLILEKVPDAIFAIAGQGGHRKELEDLASQLGISQSILFLGMLEVSALADVYRASDVFAITSTSDTQSLTLMQAMVAGLPVIGARARAFPEYINDKNGFLVEPGDYKDLAEKVIRIFQDDNLRESLGQGGQEFVSKFSPDSIAKEWLNIYEGVIIKK